MPSFCKLQTLDLSFNKITKLSKAIVSNLSALVDFNFSNNNLRDVNWICHL